MRWIWITIAVALVAQDQPPRPTFRTEANYVRVDVYPTRDGQPVLDLRQEDFEVLEDGAPQKIEQFEHIVIRGPVPQDAVRDPNTVAESRAALENSRARVFVLFLDVGHVDLTASRIVRDPLVRALDSLIGPDDLIGVMTPDMAVNDVTFARKTTTIRGILDHYWWGERGQEVFTKDPVEQAYQVCYPPPITGSTVAISPTAQEMILRRREKMALDALEDLVVFLRGAREERKAILTITQGWRLFRPNRQLMTASGPGTGITGPPPVGIDPRTGKLSTKDTHGAGPFSKYDCDRDRMNLSDIDDQEEFRRILDEANRANASFYAINPAGLEVFDSPIGPNPPPPPTVDLVRLQTRIESMRTLAGATDGLAVVDTNDTGTALKRIVADLSSYYLLGYYSSGKLDGRFHKITVRVKRPGVQVRARRGYLAATAAEVSAAAKAAPPTPAEAAAAAEKAVVDEALAPLGKFLRDAPLNIRVAAGWKPGNTSTASMWVTGELAGVATYAQQWKNGAEIDIAVRAIDGTTIASEQVKLAPGSRSFRVLLSPREPLLPGEYTVRVGAKGAAGALIQASDIQHVSLPDPPGTFGSLLERRGPFTGNKDAPTADLRFRRTEQLRLELPTIDTALMSARLLDRNGKSLNVPISTALRDEGDGSRWLDAQLALAPLAVGDYIIELSGRSGGSGKAGGETRTLVAFRVIP